MTYIVQADLEARVGAEAVRQILDDNRDGTPDAAPLARVIADAESYVEGFLRTVYDLAAIRALTTGVPNEVKRLCLDVAEAYLWDRFPEYVRAQGDKLLERARRDLVDLHKGMTRLDIVGTPEPAANRGGTVQSDDPENPDPADKFFLYPDSMGIF